MTDREWAEREIFLWEKRALLALHRGQSLPNAPIPCEPSEDPREMSRMMAEKVNSWFEEPKLPLYTGKHHLPPAAHRKPVALHDVKPLAKPTKKSALGDLEEWFIDNGVSVYSSTKHAPSDATKLEHAKALKDVLASCASLFGIDARSGFKMEASSPLVKAGETIYPLAVVIFTSKKDRGYADVPGAPIYGYTDDDDPKAQYAKQVAKRLWSVLSQYDRTFLSHQFGRDSWEPTVAALLLGRDVPTEKRPMVETILGKLKERQTRSGEPVAQRAQVLTDIALRPLSLMERGTGDPMTYTDTLTEYQFPIDTARLKKVKQVAPWLSLMEDRKSGEQYAMVTGEEQPLRKIMTATNVYRALGNLASHARLYPIDGGVALLCAVQPGSLSFHEWLLHADPQEIDAMYQHLHRGFVAHVILGNDEPLGKHLMDMWVNQQGEPIIVAPQGAFGGFIDDVTEFPIEYWQLQDALRNPVTSSFFGGITDSEVKEQVANAEERRSAALLEIPDVDMRHMISARMDALLNYVRKNDVPT